MARNVRNALLIFARLTSTIHLLHRYSLDNAKNKRKVLFITRGIFLYVGSVGVQGFIEILDISFPAIKLDRAELSLEINFEWKFCFPNNYIG